MFFAVVEHIVGLLGPKQFVILKSEIIQDVADWVSRVDFDEPDIMSRVTPGQEASLQGSSYLSELKRDFTETAGDD